MFSVPAFALTTKSIADGLTAADVAATVTGPGATITNVKITGSDKSVGTFSEGSLGVTSGIILSSGNVATAVGPNDESGAGEGLGTPGDAQLNSIVSPNTTNDAAILEFDVITATPLFSISYVFASEEYREFVDTEFNDVFAFYVDGKNIALTPGSSEPVSINTINHLRNTHLYRDNETGEGTEFDGFTVPMLATAIVEPNVTHHIKIAIADAGDSILDSAVFIEQGGISGTTAPILIPPRLLAMEVGQTIEVAVPIYFVFDSIPFTLTASGVPGATVTFSDVYTKDDQQYVNMKIVLGAESESGAHLLTIRSATADAERFSATLIVVDCRPPSLLGIGQPSTQTVTRGSTATFTVQPEGSGPFSYQWYVGFAGMTNSPVTGATGRQFTTPAVNDLTFYWVRITNACGSFDSLTTLAIPQ
ncbi:MAG TPA: choice-of-anchor L domain-containing protein [Thermoanaerobaculia bacterium]|nr:choice-of-anchor L domain-containing protein [Thermoanaerobaculia bacterium]